MKFSINLSELLKHLSFWHNKTDDECIELATNQYGVDAEQALLNILERDFCTSMNNNAVEKLNKNNSFCNLYNKECMGILCSVTPDIENCHHKAKNETPGFKMHYAPGGEWGLAELD